MSDTPRTDALIAPSWEGAEVPKERIISFTRQLERELSTQSSREKALVEAAQSYDAAISAIEKEHGRKDMELTQHSTLVPIRNLARELK